MRGVIRFDVASRKHNGDLIGWEVWRVNTKNDKAEVIATFLGKKAKSYAQRHALQMSIAKTVGDI